MQRYFKITAWMLVAYLLLFCITFGTPILGNKAASAVLTWVGCSPAGFDTPYHCPSGNIIGDRFGPLSAWITMLFMPFLFFLQFWDVLLGWLALIVLFAVLASVKDKRMVSEEQETAIDGPRVVAAVDTNFIDVLLIWAVLPVFSFAWLQQLPQYWAMLAFIFVFLSMRLHRPSGRIDMLLFFLAVGTFRLVQSGHPREGWLALTIAFALLVIPYKRPPRIVKEKKVFSRGNNQPAEDMAVAEYAGFVTRSRALGIDAILILLLVFPPLTLIDGSGYFSGVTAHPVNEALDFIFFRAFPAIGTAIYPPLSLLCYGNDIGPIAFFLTRILPVFVVIGFWVWRQATPGKQVFSLKIVDAASGNPASNGQLIGRYFAYAVSLFPFGLGFFWIIFDERHQAWHDKLTGTAVVKSKR